MCLPFLLSFFPLHLSTYFFFMRRPNNFLFLLSYIPFTFLHLQDSSKSLLFLPSPPFATLVNSFFHSTFFGGETSFYYRIFLSLFCSLSILAKKSLLLDSLSPFHILLCLIFAHSSARLPSQAVSHPSTNGHAEGRSILSPTSNKGCQSRRLNIITSNTKPLFNCPSKQTAIRSVLY